MYKISLMKKTMTFIDKCVSKNTFCLVLLLMLFANQNVFGANNLMDKYRWRNDDGTETSASWRKALNTKDSIAGGENVRLRVGLGLDFNLLDQKVYSVFSLNYSLSSSGPWQEISSSPANHFQLALSDNFVDNASTTNQMNTKADDFTPGRMMELATSSEAINNDFFKQTEMEWSIKSTNAATHNSVYYFKVFSGQAELLSNRLAEVFLKEKWIVTGNNQKISNGANAPSNLDSTYFGNLEIGDSTTITYTIHNKKEETLFLNSVVHVSGVNAGDFSAALGLVDTVVLVGESTTFKVKYKPTVICDRNAIIELTDKDGGSYNFAVLGKSDLILPFAVAKDTLLYLNGNGTASLDSNSLDNGSTDNCSIDTIGITVNTFTCSNIGRNPVFMTVHDASGNSKTTFAIVTVLDTTAPVAIGKNLTVYLDRSGSATIDSNSLNNGSTDNCSIDAIGISVNTFTCSNIGPNTVFMTVHDASANSHTTSATVTVADSSQRIRAQFIEVTNTNDDGCGSLRNALRISRNTDTIWVDESLSNSTLLLSNGQLEITSSVKIFGNGMTIDADSLSRVFFTENLASLTIDGFGITGGGKVIKGAGIYAKNIGDLVVQFCKINHNTGSMGGGVYASSSSSSSSITFANNTITGNSTLYSSSAFSGAAGGGVFASSSSSLTFINNTITGNSCFSTNPSYNTNGGGVYASSYTSIAFTNNTISANSSSGPISRGGGVYAYSYSTSIPIVFTNNTITGNSSASNYGNSYSSGGGVQTYTGAFKGNIIALNSSNGSGSDVSSTFNTVSNGYNLIGDNSGIETAFPANSYAATTDTVGTASNVIDPMLSDLADNGGPTWTMALQTGSPAINAGDPSDAKPDQRGSTPSGRRSIGAVSVLSNAAPVLSAIASQDMACEESISIDFSLIDLDGDVVAVSASSSNTALVLNANIEITPASGTQSNRSMTITTTGDTVGSSTISLYAMDSNGGTDTVVFALLFGKKIDALVSTIAGSGDPDFADGQGTAASFFNPAGVAVDEAGNVYVADQDNNKIRKISPSGLVSTLAGSGAFGSDDGQGTAASFFNPAGVAVDEAGNVYVADQNNNKIRKISPSGLVSTLAGSGALGFADGQGIAASFKYPRGLAVDGSGNVYVADSYNHTIRKISPSGLVSTLAGSGNQGFADGTATTAMFSYPAGVAVDSYGNVYVADFHNNRIRKISPLGEVSTLAGSGNEDFADGQGTDASFHYPAGVAVDGSGNVLVADAVNNRIRKISASGMVSTLAGSGNEDFADGLGFSDPRGLAVDGSGNVYVADMGNQRIRKKGAARIPCHTLIAICKDITIGLENGQTRIDSNALDNGSYASSGIASVQVNKSNFNCYNLGANAVMMTVTAINGSTKDCEAIVTILPEVIVSNISCIGEVDGKITIDCNTELPPGPAPVEEIKYSLNNGGFFAVNSFNNLAPGTYNLRMRAKNYIYEVGNYTITEPTAVALATNQAAPLCADDSLWIQATATGGVGNYSYALDGESTNTTGNFGDLDEGNYVVTVSDSNGCTANSETITLTLPTAVSATLAATSETCYQSANGTITVSASGGTGSLMYQLDNGIPQITNVFEGLAEGTFSVSVTDANNCSWTGSTSVGTVAELTIVKSVIGTVACGDSTDYIYGVVTEGGTGEHTLYINGNPVSSINYESLPAGTYTFGVTDANGCSASLAPITKGAVVAFSASAKKESEVLCFGDHTGSIKVTAQGGAVPYQYSFDGGTTYGSNAIASNLAIGRYHVKLKDANNCTIDLKELTFTQPSPLNVSIIKVRNVSCKGGSDGEILSLVEGGVQPYQYSNDGSSYSIAIPAHKEYRPGTYVVYVKDANGCITVSNSISITEPAQLAANVSVTTEPVCFGQNTGAIALENVTGGTAPYTWTVNGSVANGTTVYNLAAGTYSSTLVDAKGCSITLNTVTITAPTAININLTQTGTINCAGETTGAIVANAAGGTGKFTYIINNGNSTVNPNFVELRAGIYVVTATDYNGCSASAEITITAPLAVGVEAGITHLACDASSGGAITIIGSGGTAPYSYALNSEEFQEEATTTSLAAGTYIVQVEDANGCRSEKVQVIINASGGIMASIGNQNNVNCNGDNSGSFTVNVDGGKAPFTYTIANQTPQNVGTFQAMAAGTYIVTVEDANGCTDQVSVTIMQSEVLTVTMLGTDNPTCESAGAVNVLANGGTAPYVYVLNGTDAQSGGMFNNLTEGEYVVEVSDKNGCKVMSNTITLDAPEEIGEIDIIHADQVCFGEVTTIEVVASGLGMEYSLNGLDYFTSGTFFNKEAGTYRAFVKNEDACIGMKLFTIRQTEQLLVNATVVSSPVCNGEATGSLLVNVSGGSLPYKYSVKGKTYQTSNVFEELTAGTYIVSIRDSLGCLAQTTATITEPTALMVSATVTDETATNNGAISIAATGGTPSYFYGFWNYQLDTLVLDSQNPTNMTAGKYTVGAADSYGCWDTVSVVIENKIGLEEINTSIAIRVYPNPSTGLVSIAVDQPEAVISIEIINAIGGVVYRKQNQVQAVEQIDLSGAAKGAYYVRVFTATGVEIEPLMLQ
jgi:predicted RNase H-like HicB family nuclease